MIEWLVAAPASGGGKTVLACALLQALKRRGLSPCAFKCGPDYIDSMFHRAVLGVASCNLDLFLSDETAVRRLYARGCAGHGAAIVEGVMGLYDGLGGVTDRASAWHMADTLGLPVLLCLRPKGSSLTLAAQVKGLQAFRRDSHIAALFLTDCSAMLYQTLSPMLERETGLPVLGYLPHMETAVVESRHLGLRTAGEIKDLAARLCAVAAVLEETLDWPRFFALGRGPARPLPDLETEPGALRVPIAVAQDEAFCFTYAESLDMLRRCGAQLLPFRPLDDRALPEGACALYLPGGYPELYARSLAENEAGRCAVAAAVTGGMPTVAECGGFLYLGQALQGTDGQWYPMAGVLPGKAERKEGLVRFGYARLAAEKESLLLRAGERVPVHEFHHWDSTENGVDLGVEKPLTGRTWRCGFTTDTLYAAFHHLYFAGHPALAQRFVAAARRYSAKKEKQT